MDDKIIPFPVRAPKASRPVAEPGRLLEFPAVDLEPQELTITIPQAPPAPPVVRF